MKHSLVAFVVLFAGLQCQAAFAQSDGKFAIGGEFVTRLPNDSGTVHGSSGPGLLWRFGHARTGWAGIAA